MKLNFWKGLLADHDKDKLMKSNLYSCLLSLPKASAQLNFLGSSPLSYMMSTILRFDYVYLNEKEKKFKVTFK